MWEVNSTGSILANFCLCQLNILHKQKQNETKPYTDLCISLVEALHCFDFMVQKIHMLNIEVM